MRKILWAPVILLLAAWASPASPADVGLTLGLDRFEATLADSVELTLTFSGASQGNLQPRIQGVDDFTVREAGSSTRVEAVDGRVNTATTFLYRLQPKKTGHFVVGPAEVTVDGAISRSGSAPLKVTAPAAGTQSSAPSLRAEISPARVYAEEPAVYTLKLYRRIRVSDLSVNLPETDGIVLRKLGAPREYQDLLEGTSYQVLEIRYSVLAQRPGTYRLGPATLGLTAYEPPDSTRRGHPGDPFFSALAGRPLSVASEPLELTVISLPPESRPQDFSGLVGNFTIETSLEPRSLRAGELATLTISLSGRGNLQRAPDLRLPLADLVKVYADQPVLKTDGGDDGTEGSKTMKWALVPEREGIYQIPSLAVSYFDPGSRRYQLLRTPALTLSVAPSAAAGPASLPSPTARPDGGTLPRREVVELGRDLMPVHATLRSDGGAAPAGGFGKTAWALLLGPFLAYVAVWSGLRVRSRSNALRPAGKSRRAARKLLRQWRSGGLTAGELHRALREYLNERLGLRLGSLTAEEAAGLLRDRGVGEESAEGFGAALRGLEEAIYTGRGFEPARGQEGLPKLVARVEKELR